MVPACTVFTTECITNYISIPYKVEKVDIGKNTQKEDWFLAINPNGRIPALTDKFTDGQTINLFESGSIMQYLVERYDTDHKISYPKGSREWYEMNNWLFFQNAGVGPMQGQASTDAQPGRHAT
jgi:glutathione S-transferase